jgi:radial spoke head protein 9
MKFTAFPSLNDQHANGDEDEYEKLATHLFSGEPMTILKQVEKSAEEKEADRKAKEAKAKQERDPLASTEEEKEEIEKVNLKEIDRLHYHVRAIENDCHIVPQGSMKLNQKHEVQRNEAFNGLRSLECFDLKCYSHFRNAQQAEKKAKMEDDDAIFNRAFLDDVDSDKPNGCWSIQTSNDYTTAIIRNNVWKGYTAFHKKETQEHGGIYVGDGLKNGNFCFMI